MDNKKQETKTCKACLQKLSVDDFYRARLRFQSKCKICYNQTRAVSRKLNKPKIKGKGSWQKNAFSLLDKEVKNSINADLLSEMQLKHIAIKHRIKITTFYNWHNRGYMETRRVNNRRKS